MAKVHLKVRSGLLVKGVTAYPSDAEEGDLVYRSDLFKYSIYRNGNWASLLDDRLLQVMSSTNSALTGTNADLVSTPTPFIRLSNASLISVESIIAGGDGQVITLTNVTGATILLMDETGATAANRIKTGNAKPLKMKNDSSVTLIYDSTSARWRVVSGIGSSGTGSGTGDDLDSLTYRASFNDEFAESTTDSASAVDGTTAHTNAAYSSANEMFVMSYDAAHTMSTSGTSATLSGTPGFTVATGDVVVNLVSGEVRKISALSSQTAYTLESAFSTNLSSVAVCVSQAVHTKDIYNLPVDGSALSAAFSGATFSNIMVDYEDTSTAGDIIFDVNTAPVVGYIASPDGTTYTTLQLRPTLETTQVTSVDLPSAGTGLFLRFFAYKSSGTGTVNILRYKAFMQKSLSVAAGGVINAAYGFLNGTGTEYQSTLSVVGGKSTITLTNWTYAVGVNSGSPYGSIDVYVNGQLLPRFIDSTVTPDGSYLETSPSIITLDKDYSAQAISYEILQRVQVVDSSTQNTSNIALLNTNQLRNYLVNSGFDLWQRQTTATVGNAASSYVSADRWYVKNSLGTNGVITLSQVAGVLTGSRFGASVQITTAPTAAQTNGTELYQVIENPMTVDLLNLPISFGINIKALGLVNQVGLQFCYATTEAKPTLFFGSEQLVTVNTTNFTLGQLLAQNSSTLPTASGVIGVRVRITAVSSGNLYALNNGFVLEQGVVNLGSSVMPWARAGRFFQEEIALCQRFYEKSYNLTAVPGSNTASQAGMLWTTATTVSQNYLATADYAIEKRTSSVSITLWDRAGNSGRVTTMSGGATFTDNVTNSPGAGQTSTTRALVVNLAPTASIGESVGQHWSVDAEI